MNIPYTCYSTGNHLRSFPFNKRIQHSFDQNYLTYSSYPSYPYNSIYSNDPNSLNSYSRYPFLNTSYPGIGDTSAYLNNTRPQDNPVNSIISPYTTYLIPSYGTASTSNSNIIVSPRGIDMILIAILILSALDFIIIRPLKQKTKE